MYITFRAAGLSSINFAIIIYYEQNCSWNFTNKEDEELFIGFFRMIESFELGMSKLEVCE